MSKYDYSIRIVGQLDLDQIKEDLKSRSLDINIKLSSSSKKVISDLQKLADSLGNAFSNLGKVASVARDSSSRSNSVVSTKSSASEIEILRREKSKQVLISQLETKLAMGDRAGIFDVNAGNIKGYDIKSSYESILKSARDLNVESEKYKENLVKLQTEATKLQTPYKVIQKEAQKTLDHTDNLWSMFRKKLISAVAYRAIFSFFNTLRWAATSTYRITLDIDTQLRDINKVLDLTDKQMDSLVDKANELAIAYGRTTVEVMKAMEYFAKAGFTYTQMEGLAELSVKLQNVGDLTSNAASQFIIATNAAFQLNGSLEDLGKTIDIVNNLANNAAVTVDFLSEAMKVSGSVAHSAGLSMEEYTAALTTIGTATQRSGREVGNGLRTILLRLTQVTDSSGDMVDGLSKVEEVLRNVGIEVRDTPNTFRPAMEILTELAQRWENLTDIEQRAITYRLAGVYRSNILESFLANIDEYEKNLFITLNSVGSATRENELYINSLEASINKLKATWENIVVQIKASSTLTNVFKVLTFYVRNLDTVIKTLSAAMVLYTLRMLAASYQANGLGWNLKKLFTTTRTLAGGIEKTTLSLNAYIAIAVVAITVISAIGEAQKRANEEFNKSIESSKNRLDQYMAEYGQLNILINQYKGLREQYEKTGEGVEELKDIRNQLIAQFGREAAGIDLVNKSYEENIRLMDELKRKELERVLQESELSAALAEEGLKRSVSKYNDLAKKAPWYYAFVPGIDMRKDKSQIVKAIEASLGKGKSFGDEWIRYSDRARTLLEEVGAEYIGADRHRIFDAVSDMSLEQYEKLLSQVSANLTAELRGTSDEKKRNKIYSHLSYIESEQERVRSLVEKNRSIINTRLDTIRSLAEMNLAAEISGLHGRERALLSYLSEFIELEGDLSDPKVVYDYEEALLGLISTIDGVNADNANSVWESLLGLGLGLSDKDKKSFLDFVSNQSIVIQNLVATLEESLTPFQEYISKIEDMEKAYGKIYDLRRAIADEAGLTGSDYLGFALSGTDALDMIENEDLRNLAKSIQDDFVEYQQNLKLSEAQGLNNQKTITALYQTQLKLKEKELKILQKQLELDEKRKNLHALENERTQRLFIGGQVVYDIDYAAVEKAREEMKKVEQDKTALESELETDKMLSELERERLLLGDSLEDLSERIKLSTEDASSALEEFAKNLDKYSSILINGEEGVSGGIGDLINQIAQLTEEIRSQKGKDGAGSSVSNTNDFLTNAVQRSSDRIRDILGGSRSGYADMASSSNVNIGTVNVSGALSFDEIVSAIDAYSRAVIK